MFIIAFTVTSCLAAWVLHLYSTYLEIRSEGIKFRARAPTKPRIDAESSPHLRTRRVPRCDVFTRKLVGARELRPVYADAGEDALLRDVDDGVGVDAVRGHRAQDKDVDGKEEDGGLDEDLARVAWTRGAEAAVRVLVARDVEVVHVGGNRADGVQLRRGHAMEGDDDAQVGGEGRETVGREGARDSTADCDVAEDRERVRRALAQRAHTQLGREEHVVFPKKNVSYDDACAAGARRTGAASGGCVGHVQDDDDDCTRSITMRVKNEAAVARARARYV